MHADFDLDAGAVWVRRAAPELNTGKRVIGAPKSRAGEREIMLPAFISLDVRRTWSGSLNRAPTGLVFVGERVAALRGTTFGRKGRKARGKVGLPSVSASTTYGTPATPSPPTPEPS